MILELKKIFLNENESLSTHEEMEFSDMRENFRKPVSVDISVRNRAGLVIFGAEAKFTYSADCDRCAVFTEKDYAFKFSHILVTELSDESSDDYIQRLRHESIMGVETYERNDGSTVEYSNYADRVFENNLDSTQHFGTHHYFDDYVPEGWHEMKKK